MCDNISKWVSSGWEGSLTKLKYADLRMQASERKMKNSKSLDIKILVLILGVLGELFLLN